MSWLNKFTAIAAPLSLVAGIVVSQGAFAAEYASDSQGEVVRNAYKECWEVSYGLPECDKAPPPKRVVTFRGVLFDFDKSNIKPEFAVQLDQFAQELKSSGYRSLIIEGHTDSVGSDAYNQGLSERRANSVADYLAGQGLNRSTMAIYGKGESEHVAPNDTPENRYQNRRVEMEITN